MKIVITESMRSKIGILHDKFVEDGYDLAEWFEAEFKEDWDFDDLIRAVGKDCEEGWCQESLDEKYLV